MFQNTELWIGLGVGVVAGIFGYKLMQQRQQQLLALQQPAPAAAGTPVPGRTAASERSSGRHDCRTGSTAVIFLVYITGDSLAALFCPITGVKATRRISMKTR